MYASGYLQSSTQTHNSTEGNTLVDPVASVFVWPDPVDGHAATRADAACRISDARGADLRDLEANLRDLGGWEAELGYVGAATQQQRDVEEASHMLLYLNEATFVGKEGEVLAEEVRSAPVPTASLW